MGDVIDINDKKPHIAGTARCLACKHEWQVVALVGTVEGFECPNCGLEKGVYMNLCFPNNARVWSCRCGNSHFLVVETGDICCAYCALTQKFP